MDALSKDALISCRKGMADVKDYESTEIAYKNGYAQGMKDAVKHVLPDTIQTKALHYLYSQIRKARIALGHADKRNNAEEMANLQTKIDVLEWLAGLAIKEDCKDG